MATIVSTLVIRRWMASGRIALAGAVAILAGCHTTVPTTATTPPTLYMRTWEQDPQGGQGAETTIRPGGQFTVASTFLGSSKADIRVYGAAANGKAGVRQLSVSGSASGHCSAGAASNGSASTSPSELRASFPTQTVTTTLGELEDDSVRIHLDTLLVKPSCGVHRFGDMPEPMEFFLDPPMTWEIKARAENCCGSVATTTFTIVVQ